MAGAGSLIRRTALTLGLLLSITGPALAGSAVLQQPLPAQLGARAAGDFNHYRAAIGHKAFAAGADGAWAWTAEQSSREAARDEALSRCEEYSRHSCLTLAEDDDWVFDPDAWHASWGPYVSPAAADFAQTGLDLGYRFPDLAFKDAEGRGYSLSDLRGKVVLVHLWGSWCRPCKRELPALQKLTREMAGRDDLQAVLLQVRENFASANAWVQQSGLQDLPLFDSGARGPRDQQLPLADGSSLPDRYLGRVFPASYVLDRSGLVIFSHRGPIEDWLAYLPFLEDAARRSGPQPQAARP